MDSLIAFYKKYTIAAIFVGLMIPIGLGLIYGAFKSIWTKKRNVKERALIYEFLVKSNAHDTGIANEDISKGTGLPKDRVLGHCIDHPWIEDAGKRQRSWKIKSTSESDSDSKKK